jgi:CRISPR-associated protein Cas2
MSYEGSRYMWIFVLFDLPVKTKDERRNANLFRKFLIQDGYIMIQLSVYARICNGRDRLEKHFKRLEKNIPSKGSIRYFEITDSQYGRMKTIIGKKSKTEEYRAKQLVLF